MARQNHGPLSRAKGKLGGVVYQQYEGMQISREYQPVVKNPQTSKQTANRAKFKLASQLVAQFSNTFNARLAKLSIYTRIRRGSAINAIYKIVDTSSETSPEAAMNDVIAALNAKSVSGIAGPTFGSGTGSTKTITATDGDTVVYTVVQYDIDGSPVSIEQNKYESDGTSKNIDVLTAEGATSAVAMAVSLRALTEEGRATISNIQSDDSSWIVSISRGIAAGDIEVSNLTGARFTA